MNEKIQHRRGKKLAFNRKSRKGNRFAQIIQKRNHFEQKDEKRKEKKKKENQTNLPNKRRKPDF